MDPSPGISIIQLPADFDRWGDVLALIISAFAYMDGVIDPPSSAHRLTAENLKEKARQETGFAALRSGTVVGCVFARERGNDIYVGKLAIEPGNQGQGIGKRLMQAVEDLARNHGKNTIELETRIELAGNHRVFARLGFREIGRTSHDGFNRPTSITMRKELS